MKQHRSKTGKNNEKAKVALYDNEGDYCEKKSGWIVGDHFRRTYAIFGAVPAACNSGLGNGKGELVSECLELCEAVSLHLGAAADSRHPYLFFDFNF